MVRLSQEENCVSMKVLVGMLVEHRRPSAVMPTFFGFTMRGFAGKNQVLIKTKQGNFKSNRDARPKLQNKVPPSRFWHVNNFIYYTFPGINYIKNDTFPGIIYEKNGLSQFAAMEKPFRS
jgi:hypothetical protein